MKKERTMAKVTVLLMALLLLFSSLLIAGCEEEKNPANKAAVTETKKTPEQLATEKKAREEAEIKARAEAEKKAKDEAEKAKKAEQLRAEQEQARIKQNADQKKYSVYIKKSAFTLYLMDDKNNVVKQYDCTIGKNPGQKQKRGDMKTPTGTFYVDEICDASFWTHDFGDGKGEIKGAYGPWFISINTDEMSKGAWGGIGIHGTHKPHVMRAMDSEGCIRLQNRNVEELKKYVRVGTKVVIEE
ncbi:MAG: L,D-transpeptidase family protein [Succiniclasticum sp.]|uniref:L,D-transpeptidase n=1 Tax=Succiniclasticum sp. TaxID=2775030 RepID=UPI002A910E12|nr:L,D-transpeptidase family protein [Succiniclasticum sp.]MDY6290945.1 L,D-transpeptidase family protein [Succiniclasticum sp.]